MCGVPVEADNTLIPVYSVFIGLTVLLVILRLVARVVTKAYFWWDDLCNLFGFVRCCLVNAGHIYTNKRYRLAQRFLLLLTSNV